MENVKNNEIRIIITGDVDTRISTTHFECSGDVPPQHLSEEITAFMLCETVKVMRYLQIPREVASDYFEYTLDKAYEEASDA